MPMKATVEIDQNRETDAVEAFHEKRINSLDRQVGKHVAATSIRFRRFGCIP
jgi:hypothetical protein